MSIRVVYIPGLLGSNLAWGGPDFAKSHSVWLNPEAVLNGALADLQLGTDGISPGPLAEGKTVSPAGIFWPAYGALAQYMGLLGWNVLPLAWDWRKSLLGEAAAAWPLIAAWAGGSPLYFVAHSAGGLLARAIYGQMVAAGADAQLVRIVTIGTPHFGSVEIARLWYRLPTLYAGLAALTASLQTFPEGFGPLYLDAVVSSWPCWYELQAFAASGPLYESDPETAAALYSPATFLPKGNATLSLSLMLAAQQTQGELQNWLPPGRVVSVVGTGIETAYSPLAGADPATAAGWLYTQDGDGEVTAAEASPPNVPVFKFQSSHAYELYNPLIYNALPNLVLNGL